jgi:MFS family permease
VLANRELRRIQLAFAAFTAAEWGTWIAILVYAYAHGGATATGIVAVVQLVPAAIVAPLAAAAADRRGPAVMLKTGYVVQAAAMAATATVLFSAAPPPVAYALAAFSTAAITVTRPAQAALLPALARTPEELTGSNVITGWIESVSVLVAPAVTSVLLAASGPGMVFAVMAGLVLVAGLLVPAPRSLVATDEPDVGSPFADVAEGFKVVARDRDAQVLIAVLGTAFVVVGALDVLYVVLAADVLGIGGSGAGYLNAAFGAGGVASIAVTVTLVGRKRLAGPLAVGAAAAGLGLVVLALAPSVAAAIVLLALVGAGRSLVDVAGRTLLQRSCSPELLSRVFGLLEGVTMVALAVGSILIPLIVVTAGARGAVACIGAILPLCLLLLGRRLLDVDARATVPVVEIALLRSLPLFAALRPPELEVLARSLVPLDVEAGAVIVTEGDAGDRFYVIADGRCEVSVRGAGALATLTRGDGFGEIALLRDVPRTATVTAATPARLYALDKASFLAAVAADPRSRREAQRIVDERMQGRAAHLVAAASLGDPAG